MKSKLVKRIKNKYSWDTMGKTVIIVTLKNGKYPNIFHNTTDALLSIYKSFDEKILKRYIDKKNKIFDKRNES